jgi:hypothetical protein
MTLWDCLPREIKQEIYFWVWSSSIAQVHSQLPPWRELTVVNGKAVLGGGPNLRWDAMYRLHLYTDPSVTRVELLTNAAVLISFIEVEPGSWIPPYGAHSSPETALFNCTGHYTLFSFLLRAPLPQQSVSFYCQQMSLSPEEREFVLRQRNIFQQSYRCSCREGIRCGNFFYYFCGGFWSEGSFYKGVPGRMSVQLLSDADGVLTVDNLHCLYDIHFPSDTITSATLLLGDTPLANFTQQDGGEWVLEHGAFATDLRPILLCCAKQSQLRIVTYPQHSLTVTATTRLLDRIPYYRDPFVHLVSDDRGRRMYLRYDGSTVTKFSFESLRQ